MAELWRSCPLCSVNLHRFVTQLHSINHTRLWRAFLLNSIVPYSISFSSEGVFKRGLFRMVSNRRGTFLFRNEAVDRSHLAEFHQIEGA
ncbi:hypothetical protein M758_9G072500 [Ceratodon purpureus]|nr:hypothetical protein M758_9G072500 [Ceratodon purpureus]